MLGPVSSEMRPPVSVGGGERSQSFATNGGRSVASACSTTGCRPRGEEARGLVTQRGCLGERRIVGCAHEAAGTPEMGQLVGQRTSQFGRERWVGTAKCCRRARDFKWRGGVHCKGFAETCRRR